MTRAILPKIANPAVVLPRGISRRATGRARLMPEPFSGSTPLATSTELDRRRGEHYGGRL